MLNAPSPAATSSLEIAKHIVAQLPVLTGRVARAGRRIPYGVGRPAEGGWCRRAWRPSVLGSLWLAGAAGEPAAANAGHAAGPSARTSARPAGGGRRAPANCWSTRRGRAGRGPVRHGRRASQDETQTCVLQSAGRAVPRPHPGRHLDHSRPRLIFKATVVPERRGRRRRAGQGRLPAGRGPPRRRRARPGRWAGCPDLADAGAALSRFPPADAPTTDAGRALAQKMMELAEQSRQRTSANDGLSAGIS